MRNKILIMGLPGAGKTSLAKVLADRLNAVWFNADEVRANINKDLGYSVKDRIEQAKRMGWLCDQVAKRNLFVIADFICPTNECRTAFGEDAFVVWVDRIQESEYEDTNKLFEMPRKYHARLTFGTPEEWADIIEKCVR